MNSVFILWAGVAAFIAIIAYIFNKKQLSDWAIKEVPIGLVFFILLILGSIYVYFNPFTQNNEVKKTNKEKLIAKSHLYINKIDSFKTILVQKDDIVKTKKQEIINNAFQNGILPDTIDIQEIEDNIDNHKTYLILYEDYLQKTLKKKKQINTKELEQQLQEVQRIFIQIESI